MTESARLVRAATLAALAFVAGSAASRGTAFAEPTITGVSAAAEGGKLVVTVNASLGGRGKVTVVGTVNGKRVRARKAAAKGSPTVRVVIDPRRARIRRASAPLAFELTAHLDERGLRAQQTLTATVGVPLLVLPGLGNEQTPGGFDSFATALDGTAGGAWGAGGKRPGVLVHEYESLTKTLPELAKDLDKQVKTLLKGSVFSKVDVVGYSMGGLVAREWVATAGRTGGKGRVRKLVFLGTPNEGAPIAYLAGFAAKTGALDALVSNAGGGALSGVIGTVLNDQTVGALSNFYPTYAWAKVALFPGLPPTTIDPTILDLVLGVDGGNDPPLARLNAAAPDTSIAEIHAFFYSSVLTQALGVDIGTVDVVDLTPILGAFGGIGGTGATPDLSTIDITTLATGDGDGVVAAHSVRMDEVPAWKAKIVPHDLGAGSHLTFQLDTNMYAQVAEVLTK
ncbi:MAG: alpha/beta fold hydrolase [Planctomycetes bacterium]|nr:alpha/beta fold hydrolase [Planctomycetota bacterium]